MDKVFHIKCFTCFVCRKSLFLLERNAVFEDGGGGGLTGDVVPFV